jgi:ribosomal protein L32
MAVPKKKRSKSKRGMRRSHQKIRLLTAFENVATSQVHIRHYGIAIDDPTPLEKRIFVLDLK